MKTLSQSQGDGTPTGRPVEVDRTSQTEKRRPVATGRPYSISIELGSLGVFAFGLRSAKSLGCFVVTVIVNTV